MSFRIFYFPPKSKKQQNITLSGASRGGAKFWTIYLLLLGFYFTELQYFA